MTLFLDSEDISALASAELCERAAWAAVNAESTGSFKLPPRIDVPSGSGFLRVMPAVLGSVMGLKVMTLAEGIGNRYLVLLYDAATGDLKGAFDADELTRLRTAAFTAVAAKLLVGETAPRRLAVIGSGYEADGHLRALTRMWEFETVTVFSPSAQRRETFAARLTEALEHQGRARRQLRGRAGRRRPRHAGHQVHVTGARRHAPHARRGRALDRFHPTEPARAGRDDDAAQRNGDRRRRKQVRAESGDIIAGLADGDLSDASIVSVATVSKGPSVLRPVGTT